MGEVSYKIQAVCDGCEGEATIGTMTNLFNWSTSLPDDWIKVGEETVFCSSCFEAYEKFKKDRRVSKSSGHKISIKNGRVSRKTYACYCGLFDADHTQEALVKLVYGSGPK